MTEQGDEGPNDWEEQMLNKLAEMFKQMGMDVNASTLKDMMGQFQKKFEELGIDSEKIAKDGVNLNFDLSKINKMFSEGGNLQDMLSNLGFDVQVDAFASGEEIDRFTGDAQFGGPSIGIPPPFNVV